ncbi:uncharacterized protein LOC143469794 [Clavelina lepadiformis]|uniref:uncharacterized protein LOC143469794 n=1 Tax=Clavelina lepadiformis TaxID=159417 RepID=UPI00404235B4
MGRSISSDVRLLSVFVSRNHVKFQQEDDTTIAMTDLKSMNGVILNGAKISPCQPCKVKIGDIIEIGKPIDETIMQSLKTSDVFIFRVKMLTTEQLLNRTPPKKVYESNHYRENLKRKLDVNNNDELPCKRLNACDSSSHSCLKLLEKTMENKKTELEKEKGEMVERLKKMKQEYEGKLLEKSAFHHEKEDDLNKIIISLKEELEQLEENLKEKDIELVNYLKEKEQELKEQFRNELDKELEKKESAVEEKMKVIIEQHTKEKEDALAVLKSEEDQLKAQETQIKMLKEKQENEQKKVEEQQTEIKKEAAAATANKIFDVMERELQCPICNDLFIKAVTLNCCHTFCEFCIQEWMKGQTEQTCPLCRKTTNAVTYALAIDNTICSLMEEMPVAIKTSRNTLIEARASLVARVIENGEQGVTGRQMNQPPASTAEMHDTVQPRTSSRNARDAVSRVPLRVSGVPRRVPWRY